MGDVPRDITGRVIEKGNTVFMDCAGFSPDERGPVVKVHNHAGYVEAKLRPGVLTYCWPPSLRIVDPPAKKKPSLKDRMLKRRKR